MGTKSIFIIIIFLLLGIFAGCNNSGDSGPTLPAGDGPAGGGFEGDQDEAPIPIPYVEVREQYICDMEWELDGDLVVSTVQATYLYTPYGLLKRDDFGPPCVTGLANNDSGRGISFSGSMGSDGCNPDGLWDDVYVSGGHNTTTFDATWYSGNPDTSPFCDLNITMGWGCAADEPPQGYAYHPYTGRTYVLNNPGDMIAGDADCETDWADPPSNEFQISEVCNTDPITTAILSYDQDAPFLDGFWTGWPDEGMDPAGDWLAYVDSNVFNCFNNPMTGLRNLAPGYARMGNCIRVLSCNGTGAGPFDPTGAIPQPT